MSKAELSREGTTSSHMIELDLSVDRERIGQVLINLLTNAIKYSPQAEKIVVRTTRTATDLIVSVQDFGIGIPKEKQQHLFGRFYRVEREN